MAESERIKTRWVKISRWVIRGSRLLKTFLGRMERWSEYRGVVWYAPKRLARRSLPESKRRGEVWLPSRRWVIIRGTASPALFRERGRRRLGPPYRSDQCKTTFPDWPDFIKANASSNFRNSNRWVITGAISRPDWIKAVILYQVSYISRP
jgi:hypothetical protein